MKKLVLSIMLGSTLLTGGKAAVTESVNIQDINMDYSLSDTIEIYNTKLNITNIYRDGVVEYVEFNDNNILAHDYMDGEFYTVNSGISVNKVIPVNNKIWWIILSNNTIITYNENNQSYYIESSNFLENV